MIRSIWLGALLIAVTVAVASAAGGYDKAYARDFIKQTGTAIKNLESKDDTTTQEPMKFILYQLDNINNHIFQCSEVHDIVLDKKEDLDNMQDVVTAAKTLKGKYSNKYYNELNGDKILTTLENDIKKMLSNGNKMSAEICQRWATIRNAVSGVRFQQSHKRILQRIRQQLLTPTNKVDQTRFAKRTTIHSDSDTHSDSHSENELDALADTNMNVDSESEVSMDQEMAMESTTGVSAPSTSSDAGDASSSSTSPVPGIKQTDEHHAMGIISTVFMNAVLLDALQMGKAFLLRPNTPTQVHQGYVYFPYDTNCEIGGGMKTGLYCQLPYGNDCTPLLPPNTASTPADVKFDPVKDFKVDATNEVDRCVQVALRPPTFDTTTKTFSFPDGTVPVYLSRYNTAKRRPTFVAFLASKQNINRIGSREDLFHSTLEANLPESRTFQFGTLADLLCKTPTDPEVIALQLTCTDEAKKQWTNSIQINFNFDTTTATANLVVQKLWELYKLHNKITKGAVTTTPAAGGDKKKPAKPTVAPETITIDTKFILDNWIPPAAVPGAKKKKTKANAALPHELEAKYIWWKNEFLSYLTTNPLTTVTQDELKNTFNTLSNIYSNTINTRLYGGIIALAKINKVYDEATKKISWATPLKPDMEVISKLVFQDEKPTTLAEMQLRVKTLNEIVFTKGHNIAVSTQGGASIRGHSTFSFLNMAINRNVFDSVIWETAEADVSDTVQTNGAGRDYYHALVGCSSEDSDTKSETPVWFINEQCTQDSSSKLITCVRNPTPTLYLTPRYMYTLLTSPVSGCSKPLQINYCEQSFRSCASSKDSKTNGNCKQENTRTKVDEVLKNVLKITA